MHFQVCFQVYFQAAHSQVRAARGCAGDAWAAGRASRAADYAEPAHYKSHRAEKMMLSYASAQSTTTEGLKMGINKERF